MRFSELSVAARAAVVVLAIGSSIVHGAGALRYTFKGETNPVYRVTITGEVGDEVETHEGQIAYTVEATDAASGQSTLGYTSSVRRTNVPRHPGGPGGGGFPRPPTAAEIWGPAPKNTPQLVVDAQGQIIRTANVSEDDQLPFTLGPSALLLLEPLPAGGEQTWTQQRKISIYEKQKQPDRGFGPPQFRQVPDQRIDRTATETTTFSIVKTDGPLVTVSRKYELLSDERVGDVPTSRHVGNGTFVFDTEAGLVRSMDMTMTIEANAKNASVKIPVTLKVAMLSPDEMAQMTAEREAAAAKQEEVAAEQRRRRVEEGKYDVSELPAGATKTAVVGTHDGSAFIKMNAAAAPLVGFKLEPTDWFGASVFRKFEPVFERPSEDDADADAESIAKPGYVVSGLIASGGEFVNAVKIVFARETNGRVDLKDTYTTEWIGEKKEADEVTLATKGEVVIGIFGTKGLNVHRLGLVVATPEAAAKLKVKNANAGPPPSAAPDEDEAAQLKRIETYWTKRPGKATDLLAAMATGRQPDADGAIVLKRGERIATADAIKAPVTFRAVVWTELNDLRLAHAADQVIFNWEGKPNELRVDGGPVSGKHKSGVGQLPADQWVGIEWVVQPAEMILYVNGKEQYRAKGRFTTVDRPFAITSHQGTTKVKSVTMVK